jgi:hypothetical protein
MIEFLDTTAQSFDGSMKRIYADFNDFALDQTLPLTCVGSVESIAALSDPLGEGEEVLLSDGELEIVARVYRRKAGGWEARGTWEFSAAKPEV